MFVTSSAILPGPKNSCDKKHRYKTLWVNSYGVPYRERMGSCEECEKFEKDLKEYNSQPFSDVLLRVKLPNFKED